MRSGTGRRARRAAGLPCGLSAACRAACSSDFSSATFLIWQAIIFDDSFEHEVRVTGAEPRAVLIVHFKHPDLMPPGTNGARIAARYRQATSAGPVEELSEESPCEEDGAPSLQSDDDHGGGDAPSQAGTVLQGIGPMGQVEVPR